jgi:putative glutamine amidotransferase
VNGETHGSADLQLVLVVGSIDPATVPAQFLAGEINAERTVRIALETLGCRVRFVDIAIDPHLDVPRLLTGVSGLVVLGGADIDPALYGLSSDHPRVYGVNRAADDFTIAVLRAAEDLAIPMLCICRGAQILNVAHGGTLIPDIEDWTIHHGPTAENIFITEAVALAADSRLCAIVGTTRLAVQNGHHQAIDVVGDGLVATAWAADGIVEAVEFPLDSPTWAVAVQWHPEHRDADPKTFRTIIGAFVAELARRSHADA